MRKNSRSSAMFDPYNNNMGSSSSSSISQQGFHQFPFFNMYNHSKQQNPTEIYDLSFFDGGGYNTPSAAPFHDPSCSSSAANNCDASSSYSKNQLPNTPNSSLSFPNSSEAAAVEEADSCRSKQAKVCGEEEEQDLKPRKVKEKKKGEKKAREARFAFVTKSEVDNLEDGYRWRKYGQKAVKNSPFPRSYYKCTTQKCNVKKLIERSHEDSSMVITTYLGRHNHHSPATLRGKAAALPPPHLLLSPPQFGFPENYFTSLHPNSNSNFPQLEINPQFLAGQFNMDSSFLQQP